MLDPRTAPRLPPEALSDALSWLGGVMFEPFFTTRDVGEGVGLGLNIGYHIMCEQHNGDIRVRSEPRDTRFQIWLPIYRYVSEETNLLTSIWEI